MSPGQKMLGRTILNSGADGKGEGFGNPTSIQTVAVVRAARALRRVYSVDEGRPVGCSVSILHSSSSSPLATITM